MGAGVLSAVIRRAAPALLSATVIAQASSESFASTTAMTSVCAPAAPRNLTVHMINEAGAAQQTLDVARREAGRIWARADVHLVWASSSASSASSQVIDDETVVVVVRPTLALPAAADGKAASPPLGWVMFLEDGQRGHVIEVSFQAIDTLVMAASFQDMPVGIRPRLLQLRLLGRGLGRVVAHEIGHWLMGREHTRDGLMQPRFTPRHLIDEPLPRLPREWTAAACPVASENDPPEAKRIGR
jgi:hypothetical protein